MTIFLLAKNLPPKEVSYLAARNHPLTVFDRMPTSSSSGSPNPYEGTHKPDCCSDCGCNKKNDPSADHCKNNDPQQSTKANTGNATGSPKAGGPSGGKGGGNATGSPYGPQVAGAAVNPASGAITVTEFDFNDKRIGGLQGNSRGYDNIQTTVDGVGDWPTSSLPTLEVTWDRFHEHQKGMKYVGLPRRTLEWTGSDEGGYKALYNSGALLFPLGNYYRIIFRDGNEAWFERKPSELWPFRPGKILYYIDGGIRVDVDYPAEEGAPPDGQQRVVDDTTGETNDFIYTYVPDTQVIATQTLRLGGVDVRRVRYDYFGEGDPHGLPGDMMLATREIFNSGTGEWEETSRLYYRYYTEDYAEEPPGNKGYKHGLKFRLNGEGWNRMLAVGLNPLTASDPELLPFAELYYEYENITRRVITSKRAGEEPYFFQYTDLTPADDGFNAPALKTECLRPDGTMIVSFSTQYFQLLTTVMKAGDDKTWCNHYVRDDLGRVVLWATPAAVASFNDTGVVLNANLGLIYTYGYSAGGHLASTFVQKGSAGTPVLIRNDVYVDGPSSGDVPIEELQSTTFEQQADGSAPSTTFYSYFYYPDTYQVQLRYTYLPVISIEQHGTGEEISIGEYFDMNGNRTWLKDERGFLTAFFYDPVTLSMTRRIDDVDTNLLPAPALPDDTTWLSLPGERKHLVTDFENDSEGRIVQILGPLHEVDLGGEPTFVRRAEWTVYCNGDHEIRYSNGFVIGSQANAISCVINPVRIIRKNAAGQITDEIEAIRSARGCGEPIQDCDCHGASVTTRGRVGANEDFPQSSWCKWRSFQFNEGQQLISERLYFRIPEFGSGEAGTNFGQSEYAYDGMGRQIASISPLGVTTETTYSATGLEVDTIVQGAITVRRQYDGSVDEVPPAGGNGNLTTLRLYTTSADASRDTAFEYDDRDRPVLALLPDGTKDVVTYDSLGRVITQERLSTDSEPFFSFKREHDDLGRIIRVTNFWADGAVDPAKFVRALTWYDAAGKPIKARPSEGLAYTRMVYDSLGQLTASFLSIQGSGGSSSSSSGEIESLDPYDQLGSLSSDIVIEQFEGLYDASGNLIFSKRRQRFHDAPEEGPGSTGALGTPTVTPHARVSFSAFYPDPLGRNLATVEFGTAGGTEPLRTSSIPDSSDTCLVSLTRYSARGFVQDLEDPSGRITRQEFDDAGRVIKTIENFQPEY